MATHSSILAWRIPWTEESGGLQSTGLQRVGHNWATSLSLSSIYEGINQMHKYDLRLFAGVPWSSSITLFLYFSKNKTIITISSLKTKIGSAVMYILQGCNAYELLTTGARTQVQVFLCCCVSTARILWLLSPCTWGDSTVYCQKNKGQYLLRG